MKTNVIRVDNEGNGMTEALNEVEKFAAYNSLDAKQALRLRLLGEEMMGLVRGIVGEFEAEFWAESRDGACELWLETSVLADGVVRDELLKLSTDGRNFTAKGVMGKVRCVLQSFLVSNAVASEYLGGIGSATSYGDVPGYGYDQMWSLCAYRDWVGKRVGSDAKVREDWDELEKSIVGKLADEVLVGVCGQRVQLVIRKRF